MASLDHKIPPPVIALLCALLAWVLARVSPELAVQVPLRRTIAVLLVVAGLTLDVTGLVAFRKASTTVNPRSPGQSTAIVRNGPYRFTRNPMYLGLAFVLVGLCVYLANPLAIVAVVAFVAYITRYQIIPEERLLLQKFGQPYAEYLASVRRWL